MSRTVWLTTTALVVLLASVAALVAVVAVPKEAEASFPGKNGLIAFPGQTSDGSEEIFTSLLDGSSLKQRTNAVGNSTQPKWSPDGTKIAFTSNRDGHDYEIYVKDITTGKVSQLTDNFEDPRGFAPEIQDVAPVWSPDGTKIAFARTFPVEEFPGWSIMLLDADGSNERRLTNGNSDFPEAWSPDGTRIAFLRDPFSDDPSSDIWVMHPDGSEQRNLTNTPVPTEEGVDWKPNGRKMTYHRDGDIWKMSPDGTGKDRLSFSPYWEDAPIWSSDGRMIIFSRLGVEGEIVIQMDVDGTNKREVPGLPTTFRADRQSITNPEALSIAKEGADEGLRRPASPDPTLAPQSPNRIEAGF
jgi:TolB protein